MRRRRRTSRLFMRPEGGPVGLWGHSVGSVLNWNARHKFRPNRLIVSVLLERISSDAKAPRGAGPRLLPAILHHLCCCCLCLPSGANVISGIVQLFDFVHLFGFVFQLFSLSPLSLVCFCCRWGAVAVVMKEQSLSACQLLSSSCHSHLSLLIVY